MCVRIGDTHTIFFKSEIGVRQGDVLGPNFFKIFVYNLPSYLSECPDPVNVNGNHLQYLVSADDIVLLSKSSEGFQQRLDGLYRFCKDWCLDLNVSKTKEKKNNKAGRLLKENLCFGEEYLECLQRYWYLGMYFSASGIFNYGQQDIFNNRLAVKICNFGPWGTEC